MGDGLSAAHQRLLLAAACLLLAGTATAASGATPITRVSLIYACHLDVGFHSPAYPEPGWDNHVLGRYFNDHLPNAARLAQHVAARNGTERFAWLTHSWVLSLFFNCPAHIGLRCPNSTTVAEVDAAVRRGDLVWHAMPHNAQVEMYDADLLAFGVRLTHDLDRAFGVPPKITASQRDVPGLTRAAVPILADQGVKAISVGVNGGSAPPGVPKNRPFWWRDLPSGKQLLAFFHPGGYSGWPVDRRAECVQVDGLDHALCMSWWGDNAGPPTEEEVLDVFLRVQSSFPHATVQAGGFDGFVSDLLKAAPGLDLPVVTGEIGDTWIFGVASDPGKIAEYRALLRMRRASTERYEDPAFQRFSRLLLKLPEHTWGVDVKEYPNNWDIWANADLHKKLAELTGPDDPFQVAIDSWARQRAYNQWAVQELGQSDAGHAGWQALAALKAGWAPPVPAAANSGFQRRALTDNEPLLFESASWRVELCPQTGAIVWLSFGPGSSSGGSGSSTGGSGGGSNGGSDASLWSSLLSKLQQPASLVRAAAGALWGQPEQQAEEQQPLHSEGWASFDAPLAMPVYSTYSEDDYNVIWDEYAYMGRPQSFWDWFFRDFGKPGATSERGSRGTISSGSSGLEGSRQADAQSCVAGCTFCNTIPDACACLLLAQQSFPSHTAALRCLPCLLAPACTASGGARRADFLPHAEEVWWRAEPDGGLTLVIKAGFDSEAVEKAGAPQALWTEIKAAAGSRQLSVDVTWQDKTPTRLPEALWLRWVPREGAVNTSSWRLYKLGQPISPMEVVFNGSQALHAVSDEGVSVDSADGATRLHIRSLDAPLVSPGSPKVLPELRRKPDMRQGVAFCLMTNLWGTNYPSWFPYQAGDEHMRFRFMLELEDLTARPALAAA
ncbi:hypothetical protein ABPG75_007418 [Micractinium tetrahymenae]